MSSEAVLNSQAPEKLPCGGCETGVAAERGLLRAEISAARMYECKSLEELIAYIESVSEEYADAARQRVDLLTGLRNVAAFREELENSAPEQCAVAVFDVLGLQKVNRRAGRIEGDRLICELAEAVHARLPADSILYRGYDAEIIAVCPGKTERELMQRLAQAARACKSEVLFGVASTTGDFVTAAACGRTHTLLRTLEEAQYGLTVKKLLSGKSDHAQALTSLVRALEQTDQDTEEHVMRTRKTGNALGERLGLSDTQLTALELMCLLHDIGKIGIPLEILIKPGKLSSAEWAVLRSHADKGYQIALASREFVPLADCIRYHHERWDGKGYPTGLAGAAIPVLSRIISVVDAYDAMVNDRSYRKALSTQYAQKEIRDNAGTQFDPQMAEEFLQLLSERPELALGKKTDADVVRLFRKPTEQTVAAGSTQPVIYCEYRLNVDEMIVEAGPSFEAMTGYAPADILGKMCQFDLIFPEDLEEYLAHVSNQFTKSDTVILCHRIRRKDGSGIRVVCHGKRQYDSATRTMMSTIQIYEVLQQDGGAKA